MTYEFIPLLPLVSFLILGLFGHWIKDNAHLVAVPAVLVSWLLSLLVFFDVASGHQTSFPLYTWLTSGATRFEIGFLIYLPFLIIDLVTAAILMSRRSPRCPTAQLSPRRARPATPVASTITISRNCVRK